MADDEVETKVLGIPVKLKGVNGIILGIMAMAIAACMFLLHDQSNRTETHVSDVINEQTRMQSVEHTAMVEALKGLRDVNETIGTSLVEQNFIILSDDKERQEMRKKLRMPSSLIRKLER